LPVIAILVLVYDSGLSIPQTDCAAPLIDSSRTFFESKSYIDEAKRENPDLDPTPVIGRIVYSANQTDWTNSFQVLLQSLPTV
jgi:hypothetical protein